jgi:trigger factor
VKITVEDIKPAQKQINIEVGTERVDAALDDVYSNIQKKAAVPGYRPGKAPRDLLESYYNKTANEEAVNRLIWDCYREAVDEKGISPAGYPVIVNVDFSRGKPLIFSVKVDVEPEFRLKQYRDIKAKKIPCEVKDDDIDKALKQLQESAAEYKDAGARFVEKDDYLVCNYECLEDGKLVDKNDKLWLYISDKLQPKELLNALLGAEINSTKEVDVSYPDNYEYKELAGRKRLYRIRVDEIKKKILPDIDEQFAKSTGSFTGLEQLKAALRENILHSKKLESERGLESQILKFLLDTHDFDVPVSLVENQVIRLLQDARQRLIYQGYKKEDLDRQEDKLKESVRGQASDNVRLFFIFNKIAKQEKIEVQPDEIESKISDIAAKAKEDINKIRQKIEDNNIYNSIKEQILHEKVVNFIMQQAKVS